MRALFAQVTLSLDGVMQSPGRPDEDTRDGFAHGGWAIPYGDPVMARVLGEATQRPGEIVLGRRTYEDFAGFWPKQPPNPFTEILNQSRKYVASTTLAEPLPWENSTLLQGDAGDAIARLKEDDGPDLAVLGSRTLMQGLLRRGLVDRLRLLIHPLVLGRGRRLFPDDGPFAALRLVDSTPTTTGVIIATYEPAAAAA
jgi:dihydrofolate reductase